MHSSSSEDEDSIVSADDGEVSTTNLRSYLKIIRDPSKTAYDLLPSGETIGSFANRHAVDRYARKVKSKRERARETRMKKRRVGTSKKSAKETYGDIGASTNHSRKITT